MDTLDLERYARCKVARLSLKRERDGLHVQFSIAAEEYRSRLAMRTMGFFDLLTRSIAGEPLQGWFYGTAGPQNICVSRAGSASPFERVFHGTITEHGGACVLSGEFRKPRTSWLIAWLSPAASMVYLLSQAQRPYERNDYVLALGVACVSPLFSFFGERHARGEQQQLREALVALGK